MPGPAPKRSEQRRRNNKPEIPTVRADTAATVEPPQEPDPEWHPIATMLYESLGQSGQSAYYTTSDWATAYMVAESLSRELQLRISATNRDTGEQVSQPLPLKGASLNSYLRALESLLATESSRRRVGIELTRYEQDDGDVAAQLELVRSKLA